ncbi:SRPBCC family protein [Mycetocola spongiae]|uniref:SRPBCC family protein n=1 Tax=Mycetocola spongiae TaxID=2859226 RepID=UPI001CF3C6F1|nr:SRPBCC family protein [Mycetocola spongiae]UCR90126.1 SRPBCC family protein [Mycetocola spongiae]
MTFTLNLEIAASPERVFNFVADFATMPRWYAAVTRVEKLGAAGTEYAVYRTLPGGDVRNRVARTNFEEGKTVTFTSVQGPTPFRYRYTVEPVSGGCALELTGSIGAEGLTGPVRLLAPMAERLFAHGMRDNLGALQRLLED